MKTGRRVPAPGGNREPGLREQREEPGGLQDHGLAAGVRPGDDEQPLIRRELEIEGHGVAGGARFLEHAAPQGRQPAVEERMPRGAQDPGAVVRDLRQAALRQLPELDPRLERVERGQAADGAQEVVGRVEHEPAELREQPLDLAPLFGRREREVVVGLDDLERLDEDGLARSRAIVHDPGHAPARRGEDGQAIAVVALNEERLAERVAAILEELRHPARHLAAPAAQARAQVLQARRRVVGDRAVGREEAARPVEQGIESRQRIAVRGERRRVRALEKPPHRFRRARRREDRPEVLGRPVAAGPLEHRERRREIGHAGERQAAVRRAEGPDLRSLGKTPAHLGLVERRARASDCVLAGDRAGEGGNEAEDDVELEDRGDVARREGGFGVG